MGDLQKLEIALTRLATQFEDHTKYDQKFFSNIEKKMDTLLARCKSIEDKVDLQNGRVRKLEEWKQWMKGGMAVILTLGGVIVALLVYIWKNTIGGV